MNNNPSKEQIMFIKSLNRTKQAVKITRIAIFILFFVIWEIAADAGIIDPFIFSRPSSIMTCAVDMLKDGSLLKHTGITLFETCVGFGIGTAMGTLAAVVLWWNSFINKVCDPYLVVLNSLPKTALAPIIIVWFGNNMKAIIAVALLTSVIVTVINVLGGFNSADKDDIRLVRSFGGNKKDVLFKVVFPSATPYIIDALKINVGLSFVGVIVGEFLAAKEGLGYLIVYGSQVFKLDWVMLSVILLAILAALMYKGIQVFESFLLKKMGL